MIGNIVVQSTFVKLNPLSESLSWFLKMDSNLSIASSVWNQFWSSLGWDVELFLFWDIMRIVGVQARDFCKIGESRFNRVFENDGNDQ